MVAMAQCLQDAGRLGMGRVSYAGLWLASSAGLYVHYMHLVAESRLGTANLSFCLLFSVAAQLTFLPLFRICCCPAMQR